MSTSHETSSLLSGQTRSGQDHEDYKQIIQKSGLTIPILSLLHVGRKDIAGQVDGDLIYNDYPK